ncbi:acyltransferase [Methylobacterium nonmethylotrophicum]|uniref:Acyltransferase n=1 Tax=Methylobacterium nonmethylotrophicum TaxID=1141884 RepID=A0A4Z0NXR1_9HYPH|nr:acyltransferase [Methylobacterium nonmethylotrophicum]TGE02467.1 acyltransferase [Methylobacterium nonmethylotrophicum]
MPINLVDNGNNNTVIIDAQTKSRCSGIIILNGDNNYVNIQEWVNSYEFMMDIGHNCSIFVGKNAQLARLNIYAKHDSTINIGENTGFTNKAVLHAAESFDISIGRNCIIADGFFATVSDLHSIIDINTNTRLNYGKDITIEDRVWIAESVRLLKGSHIGAGSIVGIGSIVTGAIPQNCLATGVPASVRKTQVTWDYRLL